MSTCRIDLLPDNDRTNGWAAHLPARAPRPHLAGDVRADWIVIGAGWTGLAAARRLAENRPSDWIVIIDAAAASDGASGRNSGFAIDVQNATQSPPRGSVNGCSYRREPRRQRGQPRLPDIWPTYGKIQLSAAPAPRDGRRQETLLVRLFAFELEYGRCQPDYAVPAQL